MISRSDDMHHLGWLEATGIEIGAWVGAIHLSEA
jgi:hypothetical protein